VGNYRKAWFWLDFSGFFENRTYQAETLVKRGRSWESSVLARFPSFFENWTYQAETWAITRIFGFGEIFLFS